MVDSGQTQKRGVVETAGPITPEITGNSCGDDEGKPWEDLEVMPVLEHHELVVLQVADISRPGRCFLFKDYPSHMRPKEALICAVGIKFGVGVAMVSTMLPCPPKSRPLRRRSTPYEQEQVQRSRCRV